MVWSFISFVPGQFNRNRLPHCADSLIALSVGKLPFQRLLNL